MSDWDRHDVPHHDDCDRNLCDAMATETNGVIGGADGNHVSRGDGTARGHKDGAAYRVAPGLSVEPGEPDQALIVLLIDKVEVMESIQTLLTPGEALRLSEVLREETLRQTMSPWWSNRIQ